MDEHSLRILEFHKIRELVRRYAPSDLGRERIDAIRPSVDRDVIESQQQLVAEMVLALSAGDAPPLSELRDVRALVRRARSEATLSGENLRDVASTLHGLKLLRNSLMSLTAACRSLRERAGSVCDASRLAHAIEARVDNRGKVADSASRELARLRHEIAKLDQRIRAFIDRLLRKDAIRRVLSYPNYTVTGSHYVLPVAKDHRHEIPGIVHRTSASGDTLFIEPAEVAEMSAELALLRSHEQREVNHILKELSAEVGRHAGQILESLEVGADLCCVFAKARYAQDYAMVRPTLSTDGRLRLQDARHPLLEHVLRERNKLASSPEAGEQGSEGVGERPEPATNSPVLPLSSAPLLPAAHPVPNAPRRRVVPINVHLGGAFDLLLVTGPNTGGKTVALKTVGLLAVMVQSGLHIPAAEGSGLPIFDDVLVDIGDEQSIEQSLSTFSSHVSRIVEILRRSTPCSLVLIDELGAGTDPAEGAALGRAILDRLCELGVKTIVTTHLGDLKMYALSHPRAENAAVEFDVETLRPTYHLRIGDTGQSSALVIARRLDVPSSVVDRADRYLEQSRAGRPEEMKILEQRRAEAETARARAWEAEQVARRAKQAFEARLRELDQQADDALALQEFRTSLQPGDTVLVLKFRRPGVVKRIDHKRGIATVSHGSMQWELAIEELAPAAPVDSESQKI